MHSSSSLQTQELSMATNVDWALKGQEMWGSNQLTSGQPIPQLGSPAHNVSFIL